MEEDNVEKGSKMLGKREYRGLFTFHLHFDWRDFERNGRVFFFNLSYLIQFLETGERSGAKSFLK